MGKNFRNIFVLIFVVSFIFLTFSLTFSVSAAIAASHSNAKLHTKNNSELYFIQQKTSSSGTLRYPDAQNLSTFSCEKKWSSLWHWSKMGSLEARALLLINVTQFGLLPPGVEADILSFERQILIMYVHSLGYRENWHNNISNQAFAYFESVKDSPPYEEFFKCLKKDGGQQCVGLAVSAGMVPSFEAYAARVDFFEKNGFKPLCKKSD